MTRRLAAIASFAIAALVLPSSSGAQDLASQPVTPVTVPSIAPDVAGPTMEGAAVGFQQREQQATGQQLVTVAQARRGTNSTALMIVGGAAFLAGAVIGGDAGTIIMIGGAAVGLYGLYICVSPPRPPPPGPTPARRPLWQCPRASRVRPRHFPGKP
jgi:hypothetical protein